MVFACLGQGLNAAEKNFSVFFSKKDAPGQSRSELIFLDENGLAVVVTEATVNFRSGRYDGKPVTLIAHDPVSRLTLIRVPLAPGSQTKPVELGSSLGLPNGSALYLGIEGDTSLSRLVSRESQYKDNPLPLELIRLHHQPEQKPFLGHPIFDSAGRLVAINYRKAPEFGNGSFAFPVEALQRVQGATVVDGVVQRSWFGVELLASDPFAVVQGVRQASPAAKAGLMKGDILLQIGPRQVKRYSDAIDAFFYLREDEPANVRFLRGTEELELVVVPELVPAVAPTSEATAKEGGV
ncbi:hypothetical protein GCM10007100_37160 [Roseibacillus persicicus]|uniref:PDZ domain-containing protein n=1 Tax=Roseibacillus persicicus TaxID=454148 RepID=A0A918WQ87_9BACT|nr:hypothetical protein GCM10007100_37160 [Roseibacillus persicicus]